MIDRNTKLLLSAIAAALWALLLRPAFTPLPAHGQAGGITPIASPRFAAPVVRIHDSSGRVYVIDNSGWVYLRHPTTLAIEQRVRLQPPQ
jgi:hypothetical protein